MKQATMSVADYSADFALEDEAPTTLTAKAWGNQRGDPFRQPKSNTGFAHGPNKGGRKSGASSVSGADSTMLAKQPIADLDPHRLGQRQKQVDFGKNTLGYQRYLEQVPKDKRRKKGEQWLDPVTPDIHQNVSKRAFDGQIKVWRRALHKYDDNPESDDDVVRPKAYAERAGAAQRAGSSEDLPGSVSAVSPSPTNSRGSLDGYLPPSGKRGFQQAFDKAAGNPLPSKLMTSPAGPRPSAPQSAPAATTADTATEAARVGRCHDSPKDPMARRVVASRGGAATTTASILGATRGPVPKAPQTAPPAAPQAGAVASTTATTAGAQKGKGGAAGGGGDDLFGDFEDEDYAGLEPFDEYEIVDVDL